MKIETSVLAVAMLGEKFTGSMRLVGHLRHCLEPVMPQLRKHHGKADAGFGNVGLGRMLLRVIEKHETPPLRNTPGNLPAPTACLQPLRPPPCTNSCIISTPATRLRTEPHPTTAPWPPIRQCRPT